MPLQPPTPAPGRVSQWVDFNRASGSYLAADSSQNCAWLPGAQDLCSTCRWEVVHRSGQLEEGCCWLTCQMAAVPVCELLNTDILGWWLNRGLDGKLIACCRVAGHAKPLGLCRECVILLYDGWDSTETLCFAEKSKHYFSSPCEESNVSVGHGIRWAHVLYKYRQRYTTASLFFFFNLPDT